MTAVSRLPRVLGDFEEDAVGVVEVAEALAAGAGDLERHFDGWRHERDAGSAQPLAQRIQIIDLEGEMAQTGCLRKTVGRQRLTLTQARVQVLDALLRLRVGRAGVLHRGDEPDTASAYGH